MTTSRSTALVAACFIISLQGCTSSSSPPSSILATIDGKPVTIGEFREFSGKIPDGMRRGATPLDRDLDLLQSLIDRKLLEREAQAARVEDTAWFRERMSAQERNRLLELFGKQEVNGKIAISDEEVEAHYRKTGRDRSLRFSVIMTKTRQEAEKLLAELESGADFSQLAVQRSADRETGQRGGDTGEYKARDELAPNIAAAIFQLEVGEVTPPVTVPYEHLPHFCLFKIIDEQPMPLASSRSIILNELTTQKRAERTEFLIDSLAAVYRPQINQEALAELLQQCRASSGGEVVLDAPQRPIFTDSEGATTLEEFVESARLLHIDGSGLADSAQTVYLLEHIFIPERTFLLAAEKLGLDKDPQFLERLARKRQDLLLSALRRREVDRHVVVTPEEAQGFYDDHPGKFTSPPTTVIAEILVDSDTLATQLKQRLLQGEFPEEMAMRYSTRQEALHHAGRIPLNVYNKVFFREIYELAQRLEIDEIGGPVRTRRGYSVFKVVDRQQELAPYHEESQRRARAYVKIDKARRGYVDYVRGLREGIQIEIFEDNLRQLHQKSDPAT